ncbi:MAG: 23S rRNA (uracil(1939)-C(5))-methyltransferase RlmD [Gammaproteobacteria bacterium]|nr:23S rRNA (uracil(1939)-C(5))-methyltransferase RlmD [Gammaproteobacteria bacterium]
MARRRRRPKLPTEPVRATIEDLSHDGRGVTHIDGKTVFVEGALKGEEVSFLYVEKKRSYDVGAVQTVHHAAPERVEPKCAVFGVCGGCALQHMEAGAQILAKQEVLLENFERIGKVCPGEVLPPLTGPHWGYRRKARLGVRNVPKKGRVLIGFREKRKPYIVDMQRCEVLHPSVGEHLHELSELVGSLDACDRIAQIEVAVDDRQTALVFRNLDPLSDNDREKMSVFAQEHEICFFLQPGGPDSVEPLWPAQTQLSYALPEFDVRFNFTPTGFTQVNTDINRKMVPYAIDLLEVQPDERVLDLFCGIGNFTLPLARRAKQVVGVEGLDILVQRARENAALNGIDNVEFHVADLAKGVELLPWWSHRRVSSGHVDVSSIHGDKGFDKVLLDPARDGAMEALPHIAKLGVKRIVYVSCNPATLARDAGLLVHDHGYTLEKAGVMDMFPHTAHVESIALFTKD